MGSAASTASAPVSPAIRSSSPASVTAATYDGIVLEEAALTLAILAVALSIAAVVLARRRRPDPTAEARRQLETLVEAQTAVSAGGAERPARADARRLALHTRRGRTADRRRAATGAGGARARGGRRARRRPGRDHAPRRRAPAWLARRPRPNTAGARDRAAAARAAPEAADRGSGGEDRGRGVGARRTSDEQRASVLRLREELERARSRRCRRRWRSSRRIRASGAA